MKYKLLALFGALGVVGYLYRDRIAAAALELAARFNVSVDDDTEDPQYLDGFPSGKEN